MELQKRRWLFKTILSVSLLSFYSVCLAKADKHVIQPLNGTGIASYYHDKYHGRTTSNGDAYDKNGMTAAHNTLPLGTRLRVTNLKNNRSVIVKVNDRMSKHNRRLIDLSRRAAKELGFIRAGLTNVKIEILHST
ncbi:MAG: septal ring lytic transglycosylase RlpA family protein [Gammaproteobacteria bacterium]